MDSSDFLKYIEPYPSKVLLNNSVVKVNNITEQDVRRSTLNSYLLTFNDDRDNYYLRFLAFDFDCKKLGDLGENEAVEHASKLWECLGRPSPVVLQRSKNGLGLHLLIKAEYGNAIYSGKVRRWHSRDKNFQDFYKQICDKFHCDNTLSRPIGQVDLYCQGGRFKTLMDIPEENTLILNKDVFSAVTAYCKRNQTPNEIEQFFLSKINMIKNSKKGQRNNILYACTFAMFMYSHIVGFNEEVVKNEFRLACDSNGYIAEHGMEAFMSTFLSGADAGRLHKQDFYSAVTADVDFNNKDIVYNPENDVAPDVTSEILKRLDEHIYYLTPNNQYWDAKSNQYFNKLEEAFAKSKIRLFKQKKEGEYLRVKTYDALLSLVLKSSIKPSDWERCIEGVIDLPCYFHGNKTLDYTSNIEDNYLCMIPPPPVEPIDPFELLGNYKFISQRSKMNAFICMLSAYGKHYWGYRTPAFYFHALSQEGINSGKTYLARIIGGIRSRRISQIEFNSGKNQDTEQVKKKMLSEIKNGARCVLFDNLPSEQSVFTFTELDAILTSEYYVERILSTNTVYRCLNDILYLFTGNQVMLSRDLLNRSSVIVFAGKYQGKVEKVDFDDISLRLSYQMESYFQKWMELGNPSIPVEMLPSGITSLSKFPEFWQDIAGILTCNGFNFGELNDYESSDISEAYNNYEDLLQILSGDLGTAYSLYKNNCKEIDDVLIYGKNKVARLEKILLDISFRGDLVEIVDTDSKNKNIYRIA